MSKKAPNVSQSEHLAPWRSGNIEVGCVESITEGLEPSFQSQPVVPQKLTEVLEDGKQAQRVESACIQSRPEMGAPRAAQQELIPPSGGLVLENVKMKKDLD